MIQQSNKICFTVILVRQVSRDVTRSHGTRSRKIRCVSRERVDILAKYFAMFTLELHHYSFKNCDLGSNTHAIFSLNDNDSAMSIKTVSHCECQWSLIIMLPM